MGYACPVCEAPQADAEHLANHLAFTALLHGDAHESWLDEHVAGWADESPGQLAPRVAERADPAEYPDVFEDTTGDRGADAPSFESALGRRAGTGRPPADDELASVLEEARDLTERMRGEDAKEE